MRPLTDFEKSSISFALGVSLVTGMVAWRSAGDVATIALSLSLPLGFYVIWGYHEKKRERISRVRAGLDANLQLMLRQREKTSIKLRQGTSAKFGDPVHDNPLAYVPNPTRGERRVLLPKDHEKTKQRILSGRELSFDDHEVNPRDQWHD